jgi:predicted nuclease with TOPRIM domain
LHGLWHSDFVVLLANGIKEQQQQIEELQAENSRLEERLTVIENKLSGK